MHENHGEAGERRESGACHQCFQYLILIYQLLVYPMLVNFNSLGQPHQLLGFTRAETKQKHSEGVYSLLYSPFRPFNICHFDTRNSFSGSGQTEVFLKILTGSQLLFSLSAV